MKVKKQLLIFVALMVLLVGVASATDVSDDVIGTASMTEETMHETQTATDMNNIATQDNEEKYVERDAIPENDVTATQGIQKNNNKDNTKEATSVTTWDGLKQTIADATVDTTITLQENMINGKTIDLNKQGVAITIDGNGKTINGYKKQVFRIEEGSTLVIKNITIANAETTEEERGGAIYNNGNLTISDSTLENNTAILTVYDRAYGGAIYNNGNLNITHTTFTNNTAKTKGLTYSGPCAYGGAIYNNGNLNITFSTLTNNTVNALDTTTGKECYADGGAIYNNGTLTITHTTLQNNHATATKNNENAYARGGAIYNNKNLNITHTTLTNNEVTAATTGTDVYSHAYGGAIYNEGTLKITQTTLENNLATIGNYENGGAIYNAGGTLTINNSTITKNRANDEGAITNYGGVLTITYSTLTNNQAQASGGAITCYRGSLTITHSTLENNQAQQGSGGAIKNEGGLTNINNCNLTNNTARQGGGAIHLHYGNLNINGSQLKYNNAPEGGAITRRGGDIVITNNSLSNNHATQQAGAIYSNYDGTCNITGNTFTENTAENNETIVLDRLQDTLLKDNIYQYTAISLNTIELSVKDNKEMFNFGEDIVLNYSIVLEHPNYYDQDILERLEDITIYLNDEKYYTTNYENYTLSNILPGTYTVYYKTCKKQSNTLSFNIPIVDSEISTSESAYDFYDGLENNITIKINDKTGEEGTLVLSVKDGDEYCDLLTYQNVKDEYNLTTETIADALKTLYSNLDDSYVINVTYSSDYVVTSSTEFTLNVIKQRNTTIIYDIINNTEGNVQINITVTDKVSKTPINDATIRITGDITQTATSGIITDTILTPGSYIINVLYDETDNYKSSEATINFNVEIDKDKKIEELEEEVENLNNIINNQSEIIDDLMEQIRELTGAKNTTITLDSITDAKYHSNVTISGMLFNEDSVGLFNQIVSLSVGDETVNVTTRGGIFEYTTTLKAVGEQTIVARYDGTDKYRASNTTQTFTVSKKESQVTVNNIAGVTCNDNVTISGMITDIDDNPLGHVNVFVYLNGEEQHVTTYRTGIFKATFTTTTVGEQEVLVVYKGNKNYIGSNATASFTTSGMKLVMFTVKPVTYRDTYTIQGKLTDHEGNVVTGAEVQLTINGETISLTTDKNGKYTYRAQALKTGNFTVTATYNDEATGTQLTATKTLTVTKHATKLVVDEIHDTTVGTPVTITGKLTDDNGTVYKNCNIYVKINGEEQHVKTDTKGIFTCTYTSTSAGTQYVTVTYKGNSNYLADKATSSITVN